MRRLFENLFVISAVFWICDCLSADPIVVIPAGCAAAPLMCSSCCSGLSAVSHSSDMVEMVVIYFSLQVRGG